MRKIKKLRKYIFTAAVFIAMGLFLFGMKGALSFFTDKAVLMEQIKTGTWNYSLAVDAGPGTWNGKNGVTLFEKQEPETIINIPDAQRDGYVFNGWNVDKNNKGTLDAKNRTYKIDAKSKDIITARWKVSSGTVKARSLTYNGQEQSLVESSNLPSDASVLYSLDNKNYTSIVPSRKDAGTVTVYYKITGPNAEAKTGNLNVTIGKKDAVIASSSDSKEYDGGPLTNNTASVSGFLTGEGIDVSVTGSRTLPGSEKNSFTYSAKSGTNLNNYNIVKKEGTLTVNDRTKPWEITVASKSGTITYDGKSHTVSGFNSLEFTENGHKYTANGISASVSGIDAGTYQNSIKGTVSIKDASGNDVTKQFHITLSIGDLTIQKKNPALKLSASSGTLNYPQTGYVTFSYDGDGTVTASVDPTAATVSVSKGTLTITPMNVSKTVSIAIAASEGKNYTSASAIYQLTVKQQYKVSYDPNGGTGAMTPDQVIYGTSYMTKKNAFTRDSYVFNGWNEKPDGSGTAWNLNSSGVYESGSPWTWTYTHDITLYAQWREYQFVGWNTKPDGSGKSYAPGSTIPNDGSVSNLYAQWK